jgi:hypothetical protein
MLHSTALERPIEYQNQQERKRNEPIPAFPIGPVTTRGQVTPGSTTTTTTSMSNPALSHRALSLPDTGTLTRQPGVCTALYFCMDICQI